MGFERGFVSMVAGNKWSFVVVRDESTSMERSQNLKCRFVRFADFMKLIWISSDGVPRMSLPTLRADLLCSYSMCLWLRRVLAC